MITKGIVEQIDRNNPYTAKVRIPVFNKAQGVVGATPTNQLYTASICCLPNCNPNIKVGDVVYVSFEDNYIDKPIILGHLYNGVSNLNTTVGLKTDSVEATVTARLPADTNIGDTTSNDFVNLQNTRSNLQGQIDLLSQNANSLNNYVDIVTAPKPWIEVGDEIVSPSVKDAGQQTTIAVSNVFALATNNLLYIEIPIKTTYLTDIIEVEFLLNSNLPTSLTEDQKTFISYFNKEFSLLSAQQVVGDQLQHTAFDTHTFIIATKNEGSKKYSFLTSYNPEYYYNQYSEMILSESCGLTSVVYDQSWSFTTTFAPKKMISVYGCDSTSNNMIRIYPSSSGWSLSKTGDKDYTINYSSTISLAKSVIVSYVNVESDQQLPENTVRYGFLFALSD